jgi:GNAT superfamily N-acetyltransferase
LTAALANRHWYDSYKAFVGDLDGEFREFGSIGAFLGGIPLPFANGALVLRETTPADLDAAITWITSGGVPHAVRIEESLAPYLLHVIEAHGLELDPWPMPGMVLSPVLNAPAPPPNVTVEKVAAGSYSDYIHVLIETGMAAEWAERTFPLRLIDRDDLGFFLARLDGRPVGTSLAVRTPGSGGIYSVGTVEDVRRRGVGTAVTWAAVEHIRAWGCDAAVLQASAMGYPIYSSMGFREVVRYARFRPPSSPPPPGP